jgi:hypothetical protein
VSQKFPPVLTFDFPPSFSRTQVASCLTLIGRPCLDRRLRRRYG